MEKKPNIFLFCVPAGWGNDVIGYALAEDGTGLGSHLSSNESFSKHDMGLNSDRKHEGYAQHYPRGFNLVWVSGNELDTHKEFNEAFELNQKQAA